MNENSLRLEAAQLDAADELRHFRDEFHLPRNAHGEALVYLCGHSLGLQPRGARKLVEQELENWQHSAVEAHFFGERPWVAYHEQLAERLASLAGADRTEVVAMNSLSVNLHLLLVSFYRPTRDRYKILIEQNAFPSDRYAVVSQLRWHGFDPQTALIEVAPRPGESALRTDDLCSIIEREGSKIATILLPGVNYLTGERFDIARISTIASRQGCVVGFDLAHAIGNVPLAIHDCNVDFAVWCSYKYLNGGPGAIGGAFVHKRHARSFDLPRFAGWWGHDKASRFAMPQTFAPLSGAEGWQVSNPPILAMAPLLASLEIFERAGMTRLRAKSQRLTSFLARAIETRLSSRVEIVTPLDPDARGCQLSLSLNREPAKIEPVRARLSAAGIVCDWRESNVLRVAPVPLYNTYNDAWRLVAALEEILA
jgi:kynureninase